MNPPIVPSSVLMEPVSLRLSCAINSFAPVHAGSKPSFFHPFSPDKSEAILI